MRANLPGIDTSLDQLRIRCDHDRVVVTQEDRPFEAESGQLVLDFDVASLQHQAAQVLCLPLAELDDGEPTTAHEWFRRGCDLDQERDGAPCDGAGLIAARHAYESALGLDPTLAAAWTNLGSLHAELGDVESAREHFEQALRCDPNQPEAQCNLAELALRDGETESAIASYRHVLRSDPEWTEAHYGLARALLAVGGKHQALAHLERFCTAVERIPVTDRDAELEQRRRCALQVADGLRAELAR